MPTRRGWQVTGASVVVIVLGRVLGLVGLYVVGTTGLVLVAAAWVWVAAHRVRIEASRQLQPARVHVGGTAQVEVSVTNRAARRSPVLGAADPFARSPAGGGGGLGGPRAARFVLAPLAPGTAALATYRLPTEHRGLFCLGPLTVELRDPFGLAASIRPVAGTQRLTVLPRLHTIAPPGPGAGDGPQAGPDQRSRRGQGGDDFYALRPYAVGDDLRRVHWPSTARLDELMVRQDGVPWQGRTTVLADLRAAVHTAASLELVVSAAASVVAAASRDGCQVRLLGSDGSDSGEGTGPHHLQVLLERLAQAGPAPAASSGPASSPAASSPAAGPFRPRSGPARSAATSLAPVLGRLRLLPSGTCLVVVTTTGAGNADLEAMCQPGLRSSSVVVVMVDRPATDLPEAGLSAAGGEARRALPSHVRSVWVDAARPFPEAWAQAMGPARRHPRQPVGG